ncbi:hypothetical protein EON83_29985 [bacterium]|nr:MAG: hypothetical protein EON83_29985 [bacterium]
MPRSAPPIRRRVRVQQRTGDEVTFVTKSFTKNDGTRYHPVINEATGEFFCDCPDHTHRKSFCKHLRRARSVLKRATVATAATTTHPTTTAPVASSPPAPNTALVPVASSPTPLAPATTPAPLAPVASSPSAFLDSSAMPRFFANERITQIIPAPRSLRAQFSDGCPDEPVLCLALLNVPAGSHSKSPYQMVMPMVAYHGTLELACDIDRPYLRLSTESR